MEKFTLQHTVLYAKGWYRRYKNHPKATRQSIWDDLALLIEMDDYLGFTDGDTLIQKKARIIYLLLMQFERIEGKRHMNGLATFYGATRETNCWQYGYMTKGNGWRDDEDYPEFDEQESVVRYILSCFGNLDKKSWNPCAPDYTQLPRAKGITDKKIQTNFGHLTEENAGA